MPDDHKKTDGDKPLSTPYGPHPGGVEEAAGGADSSPHENEPTGERTAPPRKGGGDTLNG